ncbi:hypothetical protein, partial [Streptomyces sp. ME18-1-4]|uniref:hypothetical protein n=1 Tax=Streptomyces sp. ME18-1-4 TaxID=3028685 RepID=UPI0029A40CDC
MSIYLFLRGFDDPPTVREHGMRALRVPRTDPWDHHFDLPDMTAMGGVGTFDHVGCRAGISEIRRSDMKTSR